MCDEIQGRRHPYDCRWRDQSFGQVVAIEDVGFKVEEHEFLAVLGPSGSGKTTLFRCLTGLLLPDRGTVRIDDHDVTTLRGGSRRRIAVVFQQFNLVNRLTAFQNVLAGRLRSCPSLARIDAPFQSYR